MWANKVKVMEPNCVVIVGKFLQWSVVYCMADEVGDFVHRAHAEKAEGGFEVVKVLYQFYSV
jgi:hypothetical protein